MVSVSHLDGSIRDYPAETEEWVLMVSDHEVLLECIICGKVVRVVKNGKGVLNCCGQAMTPKK